ncbi:MAG: MdtA/MuxA family multidrug efflux RND transporter periplasmic adaptor subunit [Betaproteobacteria bacterium]|nr:MdtA/MuxA family multidrug efflux RND transporter periplasmic adaptor subunit [Betaproteobacteria bacterium]
MPTLSSARIAFTAYLLLAAATGALSSWWWQQKSTTPAPNGPEGSPPAASAANGPASAAGGPARRFGSGSRAQPVTVAVAKQMDIRVMLNAIGNMAAMNTAVVRARVDGELRAIRFIEGQPVRVGQVLAEIDPRSYEVALAQTQGQLARDQAQLKNAQLDLERYKDLLAKDSIAKQQVDTQEALVKQLQGTVQTDQALVDNAKLQLSYTKVVAPISGRLGLKQADLGSIIRSGDASGLVTITQTQPIALVFALPEANLRALARKLRGKEPVAVEVWDRDQRNKLGVGKVVSTDNAIDATTGTIKIKASFDNGEGALFPNQFVNVKLQVDALPQVLAVPNTAVQRGAQGSFVYVVKDDGSVNMRRVRPGASEGDWVSIQGEVSAGERVVTDGADRLREGAKVEVVTPPPVRGGAGATNLQAKQDVTSYPVTKSAPKNEAKFNPNAAAKPEVGAAPATGVPAPAPAASPAQPKPAAAPAAGAGDLPPWFDRMPPEMQEKFKAMNPTERAAFIEKAKERRRQREGGGGGVGGE